MTQIDIISDSPTKHRIVFKTPASFRDKLTKMYENEKDNLTVIDKYIGDFNKNNGDIINEYNYEVLDERNFTVAVLFKHLFRALGTTRKYAKCNVSISDTQIDISFDSNIDINLKSQGTCDHIPVRHLRASYVVVDDVIENTVEFETMDDVETYKCFTMLISTIKDGIINVIEDVEKIEG
jgi:hypothetical protein